MNKTERTSKYWICNDCAEKKGWKLPDINVTVIRGLCGHCERPEETVLIPVMDFSGPGKKAIWD